MNPGSHSSHHYSSAAQLSLEAGDSQAASTYSFLHALTSFFPKFDTPSEPYGPWFQMDGKRGLIPSDLSISDISALQVLSSFIRNHVLLARLLDVQWLVTKDHKICAEAAAAYILAAEEQNTPEHWIYAKESYYRAGMLAALLGRKKPLYQKLEGSLICAIENASADGLGFRCGSYLKLILRFVDQPPPNIAEVARTYAEKRKGVGDHRQARGYYRIEADYFRKVKNEATAQTTLLKTADCYVAEAADRMTGPQASGLVASSLLIKGIEVLRLNGGDPGKIAELRSLLPIYQKRSNGEMKLFSQEIDLTDSVQASRAHVQNQTLEEALFRLALGRPLTELEELRKQVLETIDSAPLSHLFHTVHQDSSGRILNVQPGIQGLEGAALEQRVEGEMFAAATKFHWSLRVMGFIDPARVQIINDHHPSFEDLQFIVRDNPFIPQGHEGIFLRGLHAGIHGDFLIASHLLVPQIENSIRYVLESMGIDVSNLMSDTTQPVKLLGALFDMPETKEIFGESLCFELRGCLIEKLGYNFRNQLAHGFLREARFQSAPAVMIWWLVLRICLIQTHLKPSPQAVP